MRAFIELLGRLVVATPIVLAILLVVAVAIGLVVGISRFALYMGGPLLLTIVVFIAAIGIASSLWSAHKRKRQRDSRTTN